MANSTNSDLQSLQDTLVSTVASLNTALGAAPDANTAEAIIREMGEVNHRVNTVGSLLFTQESDKIATSVQAVTKATQSLQNSIKQISSITDFLNTITSFLTLVDKAIDTAKLVAA